MTRVHARAGEVEAGGDDESARARWRGRGRRQWRKGGQGGNGSGASALTRQKQEAMAGGRRVPARAGQWAVASAADGARWRGRGKRRWREGGQQGGGGKR